MNPNDDNDSTSSQLPQPVSPTANVPVKNDDEQTPSPVSVPANISGSQAGTGHLQAEDLDLIEKEWVLKAKQAVDNTQGDPYEQNNELNKIKADYIKKRYNRTIKLK